MTGLRAPQPLDAIPTSLPTDSSPGIRSSPGTVARGVRSVLVHSIAKSNGNEDILPSGKYLQGAPPGQTGGAYSLWARRRHATARLIATGRFISLHGPRPEAGRLPVERRKEKTPGKGSGAQGCLPAAGARLARLPSRDDTSRGRSCTALPRPDPCIGDPDPERDGSNGEHRSLVSAAFILTGNAL